MAGSKRPSFLKRQKEQQRLARAVEKRESKVAKKQAKADGTLEPEEEFQVLRGPRELDEYGNPI